MKPTPLSLVLAGLVFLWSACSIVDPFFIALNLPLEACAGINDGTNWNESNVYDIHEEVAAMSSDYPGNVRATRVNDISVYMPTPPATGSGTGSVSFALNGAAQLTTLLTFTNLPFDSLRGDGISLRSRITNPGQVVFNQTGLTALLNALQDSTGLPPITIRVATSGSTTVNVPQGTPICARIHYQADVEVSE